MHQPASRFYQIRWMETGLLRAVGILRDSLVAVRGGYKGWELKDIAV